jgi:hypothetical protein
VKAPQILRMGLYTLEQRGIQRDQPDGERSMPAVVAAFNALTGHTLTEQQGWLLLALVKVKRSQTGKPDPDHYVDGANYIALAGEAALADSIAETAHRELQDLLRERARQSAENEPVRAAPMTTTIRPCKACDGTGNCAIDRANYIRCPACRGTGRAGRDLPLATEPPPGVCPICAGIGRDAVDLDQPCRTCGGTGAD